MAKKSRAGRRRNSVLRPTFRAWRVWRARFCRQLERYGEQRFNGVEPGRLRLMKRKLTISAARNAKRNSPRLGVTPVNPEEERPRTHDDINSPDDLDSDDESDAEPDPEPTPRAPAEGRFRAPERRGVDRWAGE